LRFFSPFNDTNISHYKGKIPQQLGDGIKGVDLGLDGYDDPFLTQTALKQNERLQVISNIKKNSINVESCNTY
jgi:hypothetical protein